MLRSLLKVLLTSDASDKELRRVLQLALMHDTTDFMASMQYESEQGNEAAICVIDWVNDANLTVQDLLYF